GRGLVRASIWGALDGVFRALQVSGPHPFRRPHRHRRPLPHPGPGSGARRPGVPWMGCSVHHRSAARTRRAARTHTRGRGPVRASTWGALDGAFRAPQVSGPHPLSGAARPCSWCPILSYPEHTVDTMTPTPSSTTQNTGPAAEETDTQFAQKFEPPPGFVTTAVPAVDVLVPDAFSRWDPGQQRGYLAQRAINAA